MQPFHRFEFIAALERNVPEVRAALWDLVRAQGSDVDLRPWLARFHLDTPGLEWFAEDARFRARQMAEIGNSPWRGPAIALRTGEYQGVPPPRWEPALVGESRETMRERFEAYLDDVEDAESAAGREIAVERDTKIPRVNRWDLFVRRLVRGTSYFALSDWLAHATRLDPLEQASSRAVESAVKSLAKRIGVSLTVTETKDSA
jgi:hypothetical protein